MKHVGPIELHNASYASEAFGRPAKRNSIFKRVLVAMHRSRRRQARNVIRRYRDLLADDSCGQSASIIHCFSTKEDTQNAKADHTFGR